MAYSNLEKIHKRKEVPKKIKPKITKPKATPVKKQKKSDKSSIFCYTDGSYTNKNNSGSWCAYLDCCGVSTLLFGAVQGTTVNRMELTAVIEALSFIKEPSIFYIKSDSAYVVNSISKRWVHNWAKHNWKTYSGNDVSNQDLWMKVLELLKVHTVYMIWVKGHSGEPGNELVDGVAQYWRKNRYPYR